MQLTPLEKTAAVQELMQISLLKGKKEGKSEGKKEGEKKGRRETALNLLQMRMLTAEQIAKATGLTLAEVKKLKKKL